MALIHCPDCKKKVSTTASACPHCGYRMYSEKGTPLYPKPKKFNISLECGQEHTKLTEFVRTSYIF
ncbi:MAG: hypothetical protein KAH06_03060 [Desulfobacterales bacterium]|nr:hypothetical protein [Desulfobacterales bacterium]